MQAMWKRSARHTTCGRVGDVAAYAVVAAPPDECHAVERHVGGCGFCADELAWMVDVTAALSVMPRTG